jgi:dienelactone hydrolase
MKCIVFIFVFLLSAFALSGCQTSPVKNSSGFTPISENKTRVWFHSPIFYNVEDLRLTGSYGNKINGELTFPSGASGKIPAAVILHTCSGPGITETRIKEHLLKSGFATLTFNNQTPRGWSPGQVCGGKIRGGASNWTQLGDAYSALLLLTKHPGIDSTRIAVVGASQGGGTAFLASFEKPRAALVGKEGPGFNAHVSFFPGGSYAFHGAEAHTGAPVLLMLGEKDDWTPAKRVTTVVKYLQNKTPELPIQIKQYDAYHGWLSNAPKSYSNRRKSFADCPFTLFSPELTKSKITVEGKVSKLSAGEWQTMYRQCRKNGATLEGNNDAAMRSLQDAAEFLKKAMI